MNGQGSGVNVSAIIPLMIVIGVILVALIAVLIWLLVRGKREPEAVANADRLIKAVDNRSLPDQVEPERASLAGLLSISRDWNNDWDIRVQGRKITSLVDVTDTTVRNNTMEAIKVLVTLARNYVQGGGEVAPKPAPPVIAPDPALLRQERSLSPLRTPRTSTSLGSINLAREIGEIVDELLAADPLLRNHSVQLLNVPGGGIKFVFGGQTYAELDEIPNDGIKEIIRKATQEWNRR